MTQPSTGPDAFKVFQNVSRETIAAFETLNVSRETIGAFEALVGLLCQWQQKINLVGPKTLQEVWTRHILDSAQLFAHLPPEASTLLDLGSGAGFPGLVLAIMLKERPGTHVHLVESDTRKCAFLREAVRITAAPAIIHAERIESLKTADLGAPFAVITARALKPLTELLELAAPFVGANTKCLFLKGQDVEQELTAAHKYWKLHYHLAPSLSGPRGVVLIIEGLARA